MKKILTIVAALAMAFFVMVLGVQPASAGILCDTTGQCGTIKHYSPDSGYDAPIAIRCNYGSGPTRFVYEGQSSKLRCRDTDQVYVRANEEIRCRTLSGAWFTRFDAKGWHKIKDTFTQSCVVQRD